MENQNKPRLLTAKEKDDLLNLLIDNVPLEKSYRLNSPPITEQTSLTDDEIHVLLRQFERHRLIEYTMHLKHGLFSIVIGQEAVDFKRFGGFQMKEEIFDMEISKLIAEVKKLEEKYSVQDLANITTIATGLQTAISLVFKK